MLRFFIPRFFISSIILLCIATPILAQDINIYSYRQPSLIDPLLRQFERDSGLRVTITFLNKGVLERLRAEGDHSPADLILTSDIARLACDCRGRFNPSRGLKDIKQKHPRAIPRPR